MSIADNGFKRAMLGITLISCLLSIGFGISDLSFALFITAVTTFYHFAMRLLVGYFMPKFKNHSFRCDRGIFKPHSFEPKLYKILGIKKWKNKLPSYEPHSFSLDKHSFEEIINTMCISELVHLINAVLSYIPLIIAFFTASLKNDMWVFATTGIAASLFDTVFILLQRYNRPRVIKAYALQKACRNKN